MTIPPSKLRAVRLAAAEVFIAEGLAGTNFDRPEDADLMRSMAQNYFPWVRYGSAPAAVLVRVSDSRGEVKVQVDPREMRLLSLKQAAEAAALLARATAIARKVEAAMEEAARA